MKITGNGMSMTRGDSESFTVSYTDVSNINIPLVTGDIIYFTVKRSVDAITIILQKVITVFDNGTAVVKIDHMDTQEVSYGNYFYDIQLTKADGKVTTIIPPSKFAITGEITYE